ncbi:TetR family transcriptional regulator [Herbiconiux sp. KACC 21604]|uniref:TetR/AcrR family transcriptional regulator n=1 Tax=unclassified Herbiconiux TaxID=2618217 RepID=UPI001491425F|nr:TetR/AcrR family transcriptional regulator [Herbiconiux sp. SALV-R1]QJU53366.1 TetR/AcrR family transcriptional regulator [Herbiconiux sp. SALV-R1]WPO88328.1 TetR family transcriptional regulator [Herbiconiux sp. KACC 21604]
MAPRSYSSPIREEASAQTRRRIVQAASTLFSRDGYQGTTMPAIAKEAGVSVQSVHLAGPKSALLMAAFELALAGDEGTHPLYERPALAEIMALPPAEALPAYARFLAEANARTAGVDRALYVAAETDAGVAAAVDDLNRRRHHDLRMAISWMEAHSLLHGDVDADERAEVLTHLVSPATYRFFARERGWSDERYRTWLLDAIERLVMRAPA